MSTGRWLLYSSSALIVVMALIAALGGPIAPLWLLGVVGFFYVGILAWGSLDPSLEMYGDVLWRAPEAGARVALTFDDGPDPMTTPLVLDALRAAGAKATFFVLGQRAEAHPELMQRIADEGHGIGLHSYDHNRLYAFLTPAAVAADIGRCQSIVELTTGLRPIWFRPPVGQLSPRTMAGVRRADAVVTGWSTRGRDGLVTTDADQVFRRVAPALRPGAIVLLHDAWERPDGAPASGPAGIAALPRLLEEIDRRRLQAVTLDELMAATAGSSTTKRAPGE